MPIVFVVSVLGSIVFALLPIGAGGQSGPLAHILAFGVLGISGAFAFRRLGWAWLFAGIMAVACAMELGQAMLATGRMAEWSDLAVDAMAALAGILPVRSLLSPASRTVRPKPIAVARPQGSEAVRTTPAQSPAQQACRLPTLAALPRPERPAGAPRPRHWPSTS